MKFAAAQITLGAAGIATQLWKLNLISGVCIEIYCVAESHMV